MIFVSVGTQMPFDRLIDAVATWAEQNAGEPVVAQVGKGGHCPASMECHEVLSPAAFASLQARADVLVSHAGIGAIISAMAAGKPLILMPRRLEQGEHRNDHQMATAKRFENRDGIHIAWTAEALWRLLDDRQNLIPLSPHGAADDSGLVAALRIYINTGARP